MSSFREKYIAEPKFYSRIFRIAWPITIANFISGSMEIIDSIMVAAIGMTTAVSTAGQYSSIYYLMSYGLIAGIAIYASQFYGADDIKNLRKTFYFSLVLTLSASLLFFIIGQIFGRQILTFYLNDPETVRNGLLYMHIALFNLPLSGINYTYHTLYRCVGEQKFTMVSSMFSGLINVLLNYCLIFGNLGFTPMGVQGAAIATVISQSLQAVFNIVFAIKTRQSFILDFRQSVQFSRSFVKEVMSKTAPLILNETIFGFGTTLFAKAYGYLGADAMTSYYIGNQIFEIFLYAVYGFGAAIGVVLGTSLGKNQREQAIKEKDYILFMSFIMTIVLIIGIILLSPFFVSLFNQTNPEIINNAIRIMHVFALKISMRLFNYISFAILRSGGKTRTIQLLDSGILWLVGIPLAFICVLAFKMTDIALVLLICQAEQLVRLVFLMKEVNSNKWANNLTDSID